MNTLGWIAILLAVLLTRAIYKGRVATFGTDLIDAFNATVTGDVPALSEVLARTGTGNTVTLPDPAIGVPSVGSHEGGIGSPSLFHSNGSILAAAIHLGGLAKGYRFGATGPDYYDCSGLVWRACQDANVYSGSRFTTFTIGRNNAFSATPTPSVGDIVVWPTRHMGILAGTDKIYSARSVKSGIGYSSVSGFTKEFGKKPVYMRPNTDTVMKGL